MLESQRIAVRQSELREAINKALASDETPSELDAWTNEYNALEPRLRAALSVEERAAEEPAHPERRELVQRASVREYLHEAATGQPVNGASAELRQEVGGGFGVMPWEALLPVEERVDTATAAPTNTTANAAPIFGRIFAQSASMYLGVAMPSVGAGEAVYTHLSAGNTAALKSKSAVHDSTAATLNSFTLAPTRLTARYTTTVEDLALSGGLEDALRADLRGALSDELDNMIINGNGTAPQWSGFMSELPAAAAAGSAVDDYGDIVGHALDGVDGKYASNLMQVKLLLGVASYKLAGTTFFTGGETSVADYLISRSAGFRASSNMPAVSNNTATNILIRSGGAGRAVAPIWGGVQLIRDQYSGAAKGEIAITALMLTNAKIVDENGWRLFSVRTAV